MSTPCPISVYPAYDGATDTTTWHATVVFQVAGVVMTLAAAAASRAAAEALLREGLRVHHPTVQVGDVIERPWRKGQACPEEAPA